MKSFLSKTGFLLCTVVLLMTISAFQGCATSQRSAYHSFSFNGWNDKWATTVDLLEYDYGGKYNMVRRKVEIGDITLGYQNGVHGAIPIGDYLYVKWRIKSTGEVVDTKVDLRGLLPDNMFEQGVTFVIDGRQLYVYLVTPKFRENTVVPNLKTWHSATYVSYEIYPTNTFKK